MKLSDLQIAIGSNGYNPYKFRYWQNAATNSGNNAFSVIPFDTKVFDTSSNVSAGVFTAPIAGFYQFNWVISCGSNNNLQVSSLHKNGTRISDGGEFQGTYGGFASPGAALIQCAASDTIDIRLYNGSGAVAVGVGSQAFTNFSGFLVSVT